MKQTISTQTFSIKRILLLMQKTAYENARFALVGMSTIFGVFSVILFLSSLGQGDAWGSMTSFYSSGFIISGVVISGMAFANFRSKEKTMSYLMLPASVLEKTISELIMTTLVFGIAYTLLFYIFNSVAFLLGSIFSLPVEFAEVFNLEVFEKFGYYVIFQSVFLAGSATFKKIPLFFTALSLFAVGFAILMFFILVTVVFKGEFNNLAFNNLSISSRDFQGTDFENHFLVQVPKYMFYFLMAPIFWAVTYFKIKEKEV